MNASVGGVDGRYSVVDQSTLVGTTHQAAVATWEVLQTVMQLLPEIDSSVKVKDFNFWTEVRVYPRSCHLRLTTSQSYGGHYGPAFAEYFYSQNVNIAAGKLKGIHFNFKSLGIINGRSPSSSLDPLLTPVGRHHRRGHPGARIHQIRDREYLCALDHHQQTEA